MEEALLYEDWYNAAAKLDSLEGKLENSTCRIRKWVLTLCTLGKDAWINNPKSDHYDWQRLQTRIHEITTSRQEENNRKSMTAVLRLPQTRKIGNISDPKLYKKTRVGTKALISEYTDKVVEQLHWIGDLDDDQDMTLEEKHDYFMTLRQSYGRTALLLSGGGSLGKVVYRHAVHGTPPLISIFFLIIRLSSYWRIKSVDPCSVITPNYCRILHRKYHGFCHLYQE